MLFDLMCYTCLSKDKHDLLDIQKHGKDLIPFKHKLMECVPNSLVRRFLLITVRYALLIVTG